MSVNTMTKPLEQIKKIRGRSVGELLSRGGQAVSVYRDQIGFGPKLPSEYHRNLGCR